MDAIFYQPAPDRFELARLGRLLSSGPWFWPRGADHAELRARLEAVTGVECREAGVGSTVVLAVNDSCASIWSLDAAGVVASKPTASLSSEAHRSWQVVVAALPRSLPLLWRSVAQAAARRPEARLVATAPRPGHEACPGRVLAGDSSGLSFGLSLASRLVGVPVPDDLVASATVDALGAIGAVAGLREKLGVVARYAPGARRVLVAPKDRERLNPYAAKLGVELIAVETLRAALEEAFPDLGRELVQIGDDPLRRREMIRAMLRLAAGGRSGAVTWTPIARAAESALAGWPDLTKRERLELEFVRAVAGRHQGAQVPMPEITAAWLSDQPQPMRVEIVAHVVQHAADTGWPSMDEAERLAKQYLVRGRDAFGAHLKLLGALGRLYAGTGSFEWALELSREATLGWLERFAYQDSSHPLAEWLRLAGALEKAETFAQAEEIYDEVRLRLAGPLEYVELARARSLVLLERAAEAVDRLEALNANAELPAHLRHSAARWLVAGHDVLNRVDRAEGVFLELSRRGRLDGHEGHSARVYGCLIQLDRAVRAGDEGRCEEVLETLIKLEPQPILQLLAFADAQRMRKATFAARFYPY